MRLLLDGEFGLVFRVAAIPAGDAVNFNAAAFQVLKCVGAYVCAWIVHYDFPALLRERMM